MCQDTYSMRTFLCSVPRQMHIYLQGSAILCYITSLAFRSLSCAAALSALEKSSEFELKKQVQTSHKEEKQITNTEAGNQNKVCHPPRTILLSLFCPCCFSGSAPTSSCVRLSHLGGTATRQSHPGGKNGMSCLWPVTDEP